MKSETVRLILERVDKYISKLKVRPTKMTVYKADYKILRESMSNEQKRVYPHYYPYGDIAIVPFSR